MENFSTLTTFGPGIRSSRSAFSFGRGSRQNTSSLPMCCTGAALERRAQLAEQGLAGGAVVGEHPDLDQAVDAERRVELAPDRLGGAVGADRDHRVQVMGFGALLLALGRGEEEGGHAPIIGARTARTMATARKGKKLNKAWLHDHLTDPYVKQAQREGFRARAAYKLKEIDEQLHLLAAGPVRRRPRRRSRRLEPVRAAQVRPRRRRRRDEAGPLQGTILALDILEFEPIDGVDFIHGDFREPEVLAALEARLGGRKVDVVLSDMAPNLSGIASADAARMSELVELAIEFARAHLVGRGRPGLQTLSRQRLQPARQTLQGRVSDRQTDQAEGLPGQIRRNLRRGHRSQAACIRVRYSRVALVCGAVYRTRARG